MSKLTAACRALRFSLLTLTATALIGCQVASSTQGGAVGVERKQFFAVTSQQVETSSAKAYSDLLAQERKKGRLNTDPALRDRLEVIARRIIPTTSTFRPDAPSWRWEVNLIRSDELNAWCMAGGKIMFYTGLIQKLNLNDDEIAAIMGHEIAHALREHSRERASQEMAKSIGISLGAALLGLNNAQADLANTVMNLTVGLPHSREQETEADRIGIELAARAGYDPRAAITLWGKMAQASRERPPQFLSTHPSPENRQQDLENYAEIVEPFYQRRR